MLLRDINPFVRYAQRVSIVPFYEFVIAYDCRIFYVLGNDLTLEISGRKFDIAKNTLVFIREGVPYRLHCPHYIDIFIINFDVTQNGRVRNNSFPTAPPDSYDERLILSRTDIEDCDAFSTYLIIPDAHSFRDGFEMITSEFSSQYHYSDVRISGLLKALLVDVARRSKGIDSAGMSVVSKVLEFIADNYDKPISNEDVGTFAGYHPNYINRLVLAHTGVTLKKYIINFRLEKAKGLLLYSDIPVCDVAEKCGFSDSAYFSYSFRKSTGISPATFRACGVVDK